MHRAARLFSPPRRRSASPLCLLLLAVAPNAFLTKKSGDLMDIIRALDAEKVPHMVPTSSVHGAPCGVKPPLHGEKAARTTAADT